MTRKIAVLSAIFTLIAYAWWSYQVQGHYIGGIAEGKAHVLAGADAGVSRLYYFFAAATTASLTLAVIADACLPRRQISLEILALLAAYFVICIYNGERDFMLVSGVWCMVNWHKLSRTQVAAFAFASVAWLGASPVLRAAGLGFRNQLAATENFDFEQWFYAVTHFSPNVHILTNVMQTVPSGESHWHGYSLLSAFCSFIPGAGAIAETTPARWFAEIYDMQGTAGFAFSQDAEAYLNFGWFGPPIWFAVCGYLMGIAYRRAASPRAQLFDVFVWWHIVPSALFGIRSDSRGIFKMLLLGMIAAKLVCMFSGSLARHRMRTSARRRTPIRVMQMRANGSTLPRPHHRARAT